MKKIIVLFLLAAFVLTVGCSLNNQAASDNRISITGSGNLVSRQIDVSGFDQVDTGFAFNVSIHQGDQYGVVVSVDDNLAEYLFVETEGSTLKIGLKPGFAYDIPRATMRAEVLMPELVGLHLNGSSHATITGFKSPNHFEAELTGSSSLRGDIEADTTNLSVYGSTFMKLDGSGQNLLIDSCGNSMIDLSNYHVEDASLHTSCASRVELSVSGNLEVDASQNSQVYYVDQPASSDIEANEYAFVGRK